MILEFCYVLFIDEAINVGVFQIEFSKITFKNFQFGTAAVYTFTENNNKFQLELYKGYQRLLSKYFSIALKIHFEISKLLSGSPVENFKDVQGLQHATLPFLYLFRANKLSTVAVFIFSRGLAIRTIKIINMCRI